MPVGETRGAAAARIDDDQLDPALLRRLDLGPEMNVGGDQVGAPRDDQIGLVDRFRVGPANRADRHVPGALAARVAHRAGNQAAGPQRVEQAEQEAAVHLPLMRAIGIAEERQGARLGNDRPPAPGDLVERLVPADRREFALALGAGAAQRRLQPRRRMHQLGVAVDLGAGKAGGEGLLGIAGDAHDAAVFDLGQQRAHVRAIMRTDDANRFHAPFLSLRAGRRNLHSPRRHGGHGGFFLCVLRVSVVSYALPSPARREP